MDNGSFAIRSRRVVLYADHEPVPATIAVRDGRIASVMAGDAAFEGRVVDTGDLVLMPGLVDTHVHVNEPGRTEWEGFESATRAAAAGGITTLVDMPLNSIPPTTTVVALAAKAEAAAGRCTVDYGFWGGLVRGNTADLLPLVEAGVLGFKAFMIDSGVEEFAWADADTLRAGMRILAATGVPVLAHAEVESGTTTPPGGDVQSYAHWLHARPAQWETNAARLLVRLVRETGCQAHVVHLSAAAALAELTAARAEGLSVSVETCPHYLTFTAEEIPNGATHFKCAPPIRERANRERLWRGLVAGEIDCIVSDHSPCTPALKRLEAGDFDAAWGGIAGLQFGLSVVWTAMRERGRSFADLVRWMCHGPAQLAGLGTRKGAIAPGFDADFVVWDPDARFVLAAENVHHRHAVTPYVGRALQGSVQSTYVRGVCVYENGRFTGPRPGERLFRNETPEVQRVKSPTSKPNVTLRVPFTELVDLASARLGGEALHATDDFFAPKENLLKPGAAIFLPHEYTDRGKWMDGWESRRKRVTGHDWCVVRLGAPGVIYGINVDTAHFLGNFPPFCWLEATDQTPDALGEGVEWYEIVPRSRLRGGAENLFPVTDGRRFTHVRLHIEPDGGVARLRVHGIVKPDWSTHQQTGGRVDLAAVLHGGTVVACNDMFFGPKDNLIMPGRGESMADGWETRRRREPGNDWIVLRLGLPGRIRTVEIDTAHFKGNFPESCSLEACRGPLAVAHMDRAAWEMILPRTPLQADHIHKFDSELVRDVATRVYDHVRLSIYPDGGVSRLRLWCDPAWDEA